MTACPFCARTVDKHPAFRACNPLFEAFTRIHDGDAGSPGANYFRFGQGVPGGGTARASHFELRQELANRYSWAVPNEAALSCLAELQNSSRANRWRVGVHAPYAPIVEIGAGTGYWAALLRARLADVHAYDANPPSSAGSGNAYHLGAKQWTAVSHGSSEVLIQACYASAILFLCWPPYDNPMAIECLRAFQGTGFVLVGEGEGGCTGDEPFFAELHAGWAFDREIAIPQWGGIHDVMTVWRKR